MRRILQQWQQAPWSPASECYFATAWGATTLGTATATLRRTGSLGTPRRSRGAGRAVHPRGTVSGCQQGGASLDASARTTL